MSWQNSLQSSSEGFTGKAVTHWVRLKEGQERKWKYLLVSLKSQQRQLELQVNVLVWQWNEPHCANERAVLRFPISAFLCSGHVGQGQLQGLPAASGTGSALASTGCASREQPQQAGIALCQPGAPAAMSAASLQSPTGH